MTAKFVVSKATAKKLKRSKRTLATFRHTSGGSRKVTKVVRIRV